MDKSKKNAFVLMPFQNPYNSYYPAIFKPALEAAGYEVTRADDLFTPRPIMLDIQQSILESHLILCEMSEKNPNVFYELGLAHAVGRPVILVSRKEEDIPFDLRHVRIILYDHTAAGWEEKLHASITAAALSVKGNDDIWPPPLMNKNSTFVASPTKSTSQEFTEIQSFSAFQKQTTLLQDFPKELWTKIVPEAKDIWMVGSSLYHIFKEYYAAWQGKLHEGCTIKVLLNDPNPEICQIIADQKYAPVTSEQVRVQICTTLNRLCELKKLAPEQLEIRVLNYPLPYNIGAFDLYEPNGSLFVEGRPYKMPKENFPKFVFTPIDGYSYEFYKEQLFTFWKNGIPWQGETCDR